MLDTHPDIEAMLVDRWRSETLGQKLRRVDDLTKTGEILSRTGIRRQFPEASEEEVRLRVIARRLNKDEMLRVYGWHPDSDVAL